LLLVEEEFNPPPTVIAPWARRDSGNAPKARMKHRDFLMKLPKLKNDPPGA
jgi:hypothetical protein